MSLTKGLKFLVLLVHADLHQCAEVAWVHVRVGELACTREDLFNICLIRKMACGLLKDNVVQWEAIAEHVVYSILNSSSSPSKRTNGWTSSGARNLKAKYYMASVPKMAREEETKKKRPQHLGQSCRKQRKSRRSKEGKRRKRERFANTKMKTNGGVEPSAFDLQSAIPTNRLWERMHHVPGVSK